MKVILTEKVPSLGNIGEIVNVSQGHARNFLIPGKKAVIADEKNMSELKNQQKRLAKQVEAAKSEALALKKKIDGVKLEVERKVGANGKLFGSITNTEVARLLAEKEIEIERRIITIETPIKAPGTFDIKVKLFTGVEASFPLTVKMDANQAEELKAKQAEAEKRAAAKAQQKAEGSEEEDTAETEETTETTEE